MMCEASLFPIEAKALIHHKGSLSFVDGSDDTGALLANARGSYGTFGSPDDADTSDNSGGSDDPADSDDSDKT